MGGFDTRRQADEVTQNGVMGDCAARGCAASRQRSARHAPVKRDPKSRQAERYEGISVGYFAQPVIPLARWSAW
jgi:hypothetical protein